MQRRRESELLHNGCAQRNGRNHSAYTAATVTGLTVVRMVSCSVETGRYAAQSERRGGSERHVHEHATKLPRSLAAGICKACTHNREQTYRPGEE